MIVAITTSTTTTTTASSTIDMTTTTKNTATMMATHSFKLPNFNPTKSEIWVMMAEDAFAIHKITNEQRKMLGIRIALTQELRALTAHQWTPNTADTYNKLVSYLRKYGARSDVHKVRAIVAKRPIGDKTPTEHIHSQRLEFGSKPEILRSLDVFSRTT